MRTLRVAIDLGYYSVAACMGDEQPFQFLSAIKPYKENYFGEQDPKFETTAPLGDWVVGQATGTTQLQSRDWINSDLYQVLYQYALAQCTLPGFSTVRVTTGLPLRYVRPDSGLLQQKLTGRFSFTLGDNDRAILVEHVDVLPQAIGVLLDSVLTPDGYIKESLYTKHVGIIDIGSKTTGLVGANELRDIPGETRAIDSGIWGVISNFRDMVVSKYPDYKLTPYTAEKVAREGIISYYGKEIDVSRMFDRALTPFLDELTGEITDVWGDTAHLAGILIAGGGAHLVGPELVERYPHAVIVKYPEFANVRGYRAYSYFNERSRS